MLRKMIELQLGTKMAILLWAKDEAGEDEVARYMGTLGMKESSYFLDRGKKGDFEISKEWLPRIRKPDESLSDILDGASLVLSLSVGSQDEADSVLKKTGLKWPCGPA